MSMSVNMSRFFDFPTFKPSKFLENVTKIKHESDATLAPLHVFNKLDTPMVDYSLET